MNFVDALVLGVVQGLTEFLPVSSSGHLVIAQAVLGVNTSAVTFDVAVHLATLLAVVIYFWRDLASLAAALIARNPGGDAPEGSPRPRSVGAAGEPRDIEDLDVNSKRRLIWYIVAGTIPAGVVGVLFQDWFESLFSSVHVVGWTLIATGFILWGGELLFTRHAERFRRGPAKMTLADALAVGLGQALAIIPGISRSGTTIATGLAIGLTRETAARFSFLLSLPAILGAGVLQLKAVLAGGFDISAGAFLMGAAAAFASGLIAINTLLAIIRKSHLAWFSIYVWIVGLLVLIFFP